MSDHGDHRLARLLGGEDVLSVQEEERVLERLLAESDLRAATVNTRHGRRPRHLSLWLGVSGAFAAAVALLVVVRPAPQLTARGEGSGSIVEWSCRPQGRCARGDQLLLKVRGGPTSGYLAAWARRPDGSALWYFPQRPDAHSVAFYEDRWLGQAIKLGSDHPPGAYVVHVYLTRAPLTRSAVQLIAEGRSSSGRDAGAQASDGVIVLTTEVRIEDG